MEVDQLRQQPVNLLPSQEVGTIPGRASVDRKGQATLSIPIDVSKGPGGVAPDLSINYGSNGNSGLVGLGFQLSGLSEVRRCNRTIADDGAAEPFHFFDDDAICFQGDRLVLVGGSYGDPILEFRLRRDPTTRVWLQPPGVDSPNSTWIVETKDGRRRFYGSDDMGNYVVTNENNVPWRWMLEREEDRFGNTITYEWRTVQGIDLAQVDRVPDRITYGEGRTITFDYENRADVEVRYEAGQRSERPARLLSIEVAGYEGEPLHTYNFTYDGVPVTNSSLLASVQKCDAAGACLPATTFEWADAQGSTYTRLVHGETEIDEDLIPSFANAPSARTGDFDADSDAELLIWDTGDDHPVVIDDGVAYPALLPLTASVHPLGGGDFAAETDDALTSMPGPIELAELSVDDTHRYQPDFSAITADFFGGRGIEVLYPLSQRVFGESEFNTGGPITLGDNRVDAWGLGFAVRMNLYNGGSLNAGTGFVEFGETVIDDDAEDRIYNIVPLDHDGNGLTDLWLCQGEGYKSGQVGPRPQQRRRPRGAPVRV